MLLVAPDAGVPGLTVDGGSHGGPTPRVRRGRGVLVRDTRERPAAGTRVAEQRGSKLGCPSGHARTSDVVGDRLVDGPEVLETLAACGVVSQRGIARRIEQ